MNKLVGDYTIYSNSGISVLSIKARPCSCLLPNVLLKFKRSLIKKVWIKNESKRMKRKKIFDNKKKLFDQCIKQLMKGAPKNGLAIKCAEILMNMEALQNVL
ncbi:MAG: hypothetical protein Edafosvirus3_9 [Edafosvirus sp.]|uniref:Uncharacterized protein n=1 Tax=Edafosvirus sp. TaxID=2487765 RepID=A0A3G4ZVA9_9VIRU|nr:MAG: hypothetical protein Edafosvirus3_9 [Edafosvirus sp.]